MYLLFSDILTMSLHLKLQFFCTLSRCLVLFLFHTLNVAMLQRCKVQCLLEPTIIYHLYMVVVSTAALSSCRHFVATPRFKYLEQDTSCAKVLCACVVRHTKNYTPIAIEKRRREIYEGRGGAIEWESEREAECMTYTNPTQSLLPFAQLV